jgi:predicted DNA-binding transcriptional regulator AlpA
MSAGDMLTAKDVMARFGYSCRTSFWQMVKREGVPHVRINARVIKFEAGPLEEWLEKRRSVKTPARF